MMPVSIFQIYFDDDSKGHLEQGFIPYFNEKKDGYFENSVIRDVYKKQNGLDNSLKYIGVTAWKQKSKTNLSANDILQHIQKDIEDGNEKDVYLYTPISHCIVNSDTAPEGYDINAIIKAPTVWERHKAWGIEPYHSDDLLNKNSILPFDLFDGKWIFCDCNYWIAKKQVFDEYCEKVLLPALDFFERPSVKLIMPEWFPKEGKKYNSACLVMEGLFGAFLAHSDYSYSYICKKKFRTGIKKVNIIEYQQT